MPAEPNTTPKRLYSRDNMEFNCDRMKTENWEVEQIYTGCLAQGSYYIRCGNEAAVIDPLREPDPYIERSRRDGVTIKFIFETHFHADFVSGHLELSKLTGAPVVFGPGADPEFDAHIAEDGEEFKIGNITLKALHTPGHTLESTTWLLLDENGKEKAIFTGDTLFLGDVGRPDLAQDSGDLSMEDLAGMLFDSLSKKIIPLPDEVVVFPGHGAGSACGKNMMKETVDTLGNQKKVNYALKAQSREQFIKEVIKGLAPPPAYFPENVSLNRKGYIDLNKLVKRSFRALSPAEFTKVASDQMAVVLDTRTPDDFHKGFIPCSINIGLNGQFAPWVGALLEEVHKPLLIVCDPGKEKETIIRLARVGFDQILGFLKGGIENWKLSGRSVDYIHRVSPEEFKTELESAEDYELWDVRRPDEFEKGRVKGSLNKPLEYIGEWACRRTNGVTAFVYCAGGYRSMIAASILKARGIHNFVEVAGGYSRIKKLDIELEATDALVQND